MITLLAITSSAVIVGTAIGWLLARHQIQKKLSVGKQHATRILDETRRMCALNRRSVATQAEELLHAIKQSFNTEELAFIDGTRSLLEQLDRREARIAKLEKKFEERQTQFDSKEKSVNALRAGAHKTKEEARTMRRNVRVKLEEIAGITSEQLQQKISDEMIAEARSLSADRLRNLESEGLEEHNRQAKRVMGIAIQRYGGHCMRERTSSTLPLDQENGPQIASGELPYLALLQQITGVNLVVTDERDGVRMESTDGVAREICRRAVERFVTEKQIRNPENLIRSIETDLQRSIPENGRKAIRQLGLEKADNEIVNLLGQLNYRTSYTQNQYRHSIEAGYLCGLMAAELGLDPMIARRGALFHDIGKALTHKVEGSHALLGAEIARKTGEDERVANGIGAHHGEEPWGSAYAPLVAAADALSGGRPGARREAVEAFSDRVSDLQRVATGFKGVDTVHAVQGGRELRVYVNDQRVRDHQLADLSTNIAKKISDEMVFPGQIRVTVIREFRAVETAN